MLIERAKYTALAKLLVYINALYPPKPPIAPIIPLKCDHQLSNHAIAVAGYVVGAARRVVEYGCNTWANPLFWQLMEMTYATGVLLLDMYSPYVVVLFLIVAKPNLLLPQVLPKLNSWLPSLLQNRRDIYVQY